MITVVRIRVTLEVEFQENWPDETPLGKIQHDARNQAITAVDGLLGSAHNGRKFRRDRLVVDEVVLKEVG